MKAITIKGHSTEQLAAELEKCTSGEFRPTLAIVFLSIKQNREAICRLLDQKGIAIFGATTAGEFIDGEVSEGSMAIMLLNLDTAFFKIHFAEADKRSTLQIARNIGKAGKETFSHPAFIVAVAGYGVNGEMVVRGIEDVTAGGAAIFGGVAGDDLTGGGTFVFTNGQSSSNALLALVIDGDKVMMSGTATSGWKPVGTQRTITRSEGNVVFTIDEEPALDMLIKYFDDAPTEIRMEDNAQLLNNNAYFPILLHRENAPPIVRAAVSTNLDERSVHFAGPVPQGSLFRFTMPPDFSIVDEVIAQARVEIKQKQLPEADALILFSCISRKVIFGPLVGEEIEGLKKLWNAPLVGFFSYGEIGSAANGRHELHNNTCCLVALKEK